MSRHRTIVTLLLVVFVLAAFPTVGGAQEKPKKGLERSIEYKLRLAPETLQPDKLAALWRLIGVDGSKASPQPCRFVQYLDVEGDYLNGAGFIVRHRTELSTPDCSQPIPKTFENGELTLKFRTRTEARAASESEARWMAGEGKRKLEEDVGVASGGDGPLQLTRMYSASATVAENLVPTKIEALRKHFTAALAPVADVELGPGCRRILEESWELKSEGAKVEKDAVLPKEFDLVAWYRLTKDGIEKTPKVVELSFKAKDDKPESKGPAAALFAHLIATVDPAWLAPGGSKTEAAAACATE